MTRYDDDPRDPADAIIVGAGPAGSITALLLARRGLDVRLLDRATFPRPKPCGDCLSAGATALLDGLGLLDTVRAAGAAEIDHWEIVAPDGTRATGRFGQDVALSLERRLLDAVLLDAAIRAGARFRNAHVTGLVHREDGRVVGVETRSPAASYATPAGTNGEPAGTDGEPAGTAGSPVEAEPVHAGRLRARLVVGADGLRSIVARRLDRVRRPPRLRKVSLTVHVPAPPGGLAHGEMHVLRHGCVGWAPAGAGRCNVTLVVPTDRADDLGGRGPAAFLRDRVAGATALDPWVLEALAAVDDDDVLASGPFDLPSRGPVARGAALVGDAAGYYDPFTGQGIYQAMAGARALDRAVGPALERAGHGGGGTESALDAGLARYARRKRRLTRPARRVQRGVEAVLSRPWLANRVLGRLARARPAMDRLVRVTGDLEGPSTLLSPRVVSSLIVPPARRSE